jgi:hypothetical protein
LIAAGAVAGYNLTFVQGGSYINGYLFGNNVTARPTVLASDASKAWLNGDVLLPDCLLLKYYLYIVGPPSPTVVDAASRRIRLQIWRPYEESKYLWQLVWEQVVSIYPTATNALYTVSWYLRKRLVIAVRLN